MADETIKSFLVSLGWDSQDSQQRKFIAAIEGATLRAKLLGDALEEVARKVGSAVSSMAADFEQLHYSSERIGASAKDIQAFEFAVSQLGGTVDGAAASLEAMGQKLRENPGNISWLNALGFELDKVSGKLKFNAELAAKNQASMSLSTAELYRSGVGMDERTFLAIWNHLEDLRKLQASKFEANRLSGFDPDKAAKDSIKFEQTWRDLFMRVGVVGEAFGADLMRDLTGPLTSLDDFLKTHQAEISKALAAFSEGFGKVAMESVQAFEAWSKNPQTVENIKNFFADAAIDALALANAIAAIVDSFKYFAKFNEDSKSWWITRLLNGAAGGNDKMAENFRNNYTGKPPAGSAQSWLDASAGGDAPFGGKDSAVRVDGQPVSSSNPLPVTFAQKDQLDAEWNAAHGGGRGASLYDAATRGGGAAQDTRTWWERHAPKLLGGKDAPDGGAASDGSAVSGSRTARAMAAFTAQLRKEGVPEGNLRAAAAHLAGQAIAESGLDPTKDHDNHSGHGIYGARLERRDRMFAWLKANGFAQDSLEGQAKFMAHEAMTGPDYAETRRILMGANAANFATDSRAITGNFEGPKIINDRLGGVLQAYRTGAAPSVDPDEAAAAARRKVYADKARAGVVISPPTVFGDLSRVNAALNSAGAGVDGPLSSQMLAAHIKAQTAAAQGDVANDNSVTHAAQHNTYNISGASDPEIVAHMIGSNVNRDFTDLATNMKGAAQ